MWSFMKIGVKGKQLCARNHFQSSLHWLCDLDLWPFDPKVHRVHTRLMGRLHVKFHEDRCKGEAFMRLKPFYLTAQSLHCDLDLWPFDPKVHRAHTWLVGRLHVKFHQDTCKGEAFMRLKPFYLTARLQTDRRTDRVIPVYPPPNFVAGGIITKTLFLQIFGNAAFIKLKVPWH